MAQDKQFSGLNGLRAAACLSVILHHVFLKLDFRAQEPLLQFLWYIVWKGNIGVSIFFVLSGFLLSYPFWNNYLSGAAFPGIKNYIIKRAARIMPGYYLALGASVIVTYAFSQDFEFAARRIITGFTFTSGFHYTTFFPVSINAPLWSISFEVFSYILMPVFFYLLYRIFYKKRSFGIGIVYWLIVFIFIIGINQLINIHFMTDNIRKGWEFGKVGGAKLWMPGYNPVGFFGQFMCGIFAAGIYVFLAGKDALREKLARRGVFDIGVLVIVIAMIAVFLRMPFDFMNLQNQPYYFPVIAVMLMLLVVGLVNSRIAGKILDVGFMRFTGKISFGLYIWHYLIIHLISFTVYPGYMNDPCIKNWRTWLVMSIVLIALSYAAATISYYVIEKPVLDRAHKYAKKNSA